MGRRGAWAIVLCACGAPPRGSKTSGDAFLHTDSGGGSTEVDEADTSAERPCVDPEARARDGAFVAWDRGIDWALQSPAGLPPDAPRARGAGVLVEDLDADGLLDVFLTDDAQCQLLWGASDGQLRDAGPGVLPDGACGAWGVTAADPDADGDLDLLLARDGMADAVWRNEGGRFVHAEDAGLGGLACGSRTATWGDMDGDGDLDVFVARHHVLGRGLDTCPAAPPVAAWSIPGGDPNGLYENRGDGSFLDVSDRLGVDGRHGYTFVGGWIDIDADGDLDLYQINDYGSLAVRNVALLNDGTGHFSPMADARGLALAGDTMALAAGDLNADGAPDLVVPDIDQMHLLLSEGGGWYDAARARGLVPNLERGQRAAWGSELVDVDNDGLLDVVTVFGPTEGVMLGVDPGELLQPDAMWMQRGDGSFVDRAAELGLDGVTNGRGLIVADLDGDGWVDILKVDYRGGPAQLWRQRCGAAAWLGVDLVGPPGNPRGIGAMVEVEADGRIFRRWQMAGAAGLASQGPGTVHIGLGEVERVDALRVRWPDGRVERRGPLGVRRTVRVRWDD